jgi:DNA-binding transcriptional MerR regulator
MDKSPGAFRTISEVADDLDLPQHVLRFWESRFPQIKPLKRGGGRRYYRPDDVLLLRGIKHLLYGQGYTIRGVQRILKEQGLRHVMAIWQEPDGDDVADADLGEFRDVPSEVGPRKIARDDVRVEPAFAEDPPEDDDADDLPDVEEVAPRRADPVLPSRTAPSAEPSPRLPVPARVTAPLRSEPSPRRSEPAGEPQPSRAPATLPEPATAKPALSRQARQVLEAALRDLQECRRLLDAR